MSVRSLSVGVLHPSFEVWGGAEWFTHQVMQGLVEAEAVEVVLYTHSWSNLAGGTPRYGVVEHRVGAYDTGPWDWDLIARSQEHSWARHDVLWVHNYPATEWVAAVLAHDAPLPPTVWYCHEPPTALFPAEGSPAAALSARAAPSLRDLARWVLTYRRRLLWRMRSKWRLRHQRSRLGVEEWVASLTRSHVDSVRSIRHIQANSRYTAGRVRQLYGRDAEVVYPIPRDLADFAPPAGLRKELMVLWVGRMMPAKRPLELLDAWIAACDREPRLRDLTLTFVGEGPLRPILEAKLRELPPGVRVESPAGITRAQLVSLYQRSLLTVHLGYSEPFGLVPIESMAAGTPVLAHRSGGVEETVIDGETGWCVRDLKGEALVAALAGLPNQLNDLEVAGKKAMSRVGSTFSFKTALSANVRLLAQVAARKTPPAST